MTAVEEVLALVANATESEPISVDTETTGLGRWTGDKPMGICLGGRDWQVYVPVDHPRSANWDRRDVARLLRLVSAHPAPLEFWHAKFDWRWLEVMAPGIDWSKHSLDNMVGCWLENENRPSLRLKEVGASLFGVNAKAEKQALDRIMCGPSLSDLEDEHYYGPEGREAHRLPDGRLSRQPMGLSRQEAREKALADERYQHGRKRGWSELTWEELHEYGEQDARLTWDVGAHLREVIASGRADIAKAWPREMRWQRHLYRMEEAGIRVNEERAAELRSRDMARVEELERAFEKNLGVELSRREQLVTLIYDKWGFPCRSWTPTGGRSVAKDALEELTYDPRVALIMEWRHLTKAISAYYDPLLRYLDGEGRVHPSFNAERATRTGRLSCTDPALQTIPRQENAIGEIRQVFEADPGHELWEYDLAQAELRWAAAISGDVRMMAAFEKGTDLYQELAHEALCRPDCVLVKGRCLQHRQVGKTFKLGFQYGAGDVKLALTIAAAERQRTGKRAKPDVGATNRLRQQYRALYPQLCHAMGYYERRARDDGRIPLPPAGRYRNFRGAGWVEEYRKAFNSACQGGVAEFLKDVQMAADPVLADLGGRFVLQVHDSLVAEGPPGFGPVFGERLQQVVDDVLYRPMRRVRQVVEAKPWR